MKFISTRSVGVEYDSAYAVINGFAKDGGVLVPECVPTLDYAALLNYDYAGRLEKVLRLFFDFDVRGIASRACKTFDVDDVAPVVKPDDNLFFLELNHGATRSFGDLSLAAMPELVKRAQAALGMTGKQTLVVAASDGDMAMSTLHWFGDVENTKVCVFYAENGISETQKRCITAAAAANVCAVGVHGCFSDAVAACNRALSDESLTTALLDNNISIVSVNALSFARIVLQIAYFYSAYCDLVDSGEIESGSPVDFVASSGGCGNIIAGYYAYKMGLPINKIVCAAEEGAAIVDFIQTGIYDASRECRIGENLVVDMLAAGNLERLLFESNGREAAQISKHIAELEATHRLSATIDEMENIRAVVAAYSVDVTDKSAAIADVFEEYGYIIDPVTAMAYVVAAEREFVHPTVVVCGSDPFMHTDEVLSALGEQCRGLDNARKMQLLQDITAAEPPPNALVSDAPIRFTQVIYPDEIKDYIVRNYAERT